MQEPQAEEIPEIDLSQPSDAAAEQLVRALTTVGFCYVSRHDVPPEVITKAFAESAAFFDRPMTEKLGHRRDWRVQTCGYIPPHWATSGAEDEPPVERFSLTSPPDEKEALNICHSCTSWPSEGCRRVCLELIAAAQDLVLRLMRLIGIGLGLSQVDELVTAFAGFATAANTSQLRLLHYPPLPPLEDGRRFGDRCGEHTDYGCLTLVFCDTQPGLQVLSRSGAYLDARPKSGRVLVNIGDLMQRWTGGRLRSARHRVVAPVEPDRRALPRYSLVYFSICDGEYIVRPLLGDPDSFPPVKTGEHLDRRFKETFTLGQGVDRQLHPY